MISDWVSIKFAQQSGLSKLITKNPLYTRGFLFYLTSFDYRDLIASRIFSSVALKSALPLL